MMNKKIEQLISSSPVILFMKGDKYMPKCGFSSQVVQILNHLNVDYTTYDILEDEELRQALKEYSNWPTYPQLYVNENFIGGCDIITEMFQEGELQDLLSEHINE